MKNALLALLLAVPAAAQNRAAEIDFQNQLEEMQAAAKAATEKAKVVAQTVADMRREPAGAFVTDRMDSEGVTVVVRAQAEASKLVVENGQKKVALSESLPASKLVYGALIAKEIAARIYADMPACSERSYMRRGVAARVWIELGGKIKDLPIVDAATAELVAAVSDEIGPWADKNGAEMALYKIGMLDNLKSIPELEGESKDKAELGALEAANKRFTSFLWDERELRKASVPRG
jgi:hypothetical protein